MFANYKNFVPAIVVLIFLTSRPICSQNTEKSAGLLDSDENKDGLIPLINTDEKEENVGGKKGNPTGHLYLPEDYNKFEIPNEARDLGLNPSPLRVAVHIRIREIGDLDELNEKITITLDVRLWWSDAAITKANQKAINPSGEGFEISLDEEETKPKKLDPSFLQKIWKPDLFIESLVSTSRPEFIAKPIKVVFKSDGTLVVQSRVTVTVGCNMDFHYYPSDTQECQFNIRSYAFESTEMELEWGSPPPSVYVLDRKNTNFEIQLTPPNITRFSEPSLENPDLVISFGDGPTERPLAGRNDTYDVLYFSIKARRRMSYHLIQTYLPSLFFIGITWLCFVFPPKMVEVRIGITMTTLLTMTAMFASVRESTPIVSYMKAIDIWMIACIAFIFLTLLEFAALVWFGAHEAEDEKENEEKRTHESEGFEMRERNGSLSHRTDTNRQTIKKTSKWKASVHTTLEKFVMIFFLLVFITFFVLYWLWLLHYSKYFDWTVDNTYNVADEE